MPLAKELVWTIPFQVVDKSFSGILKAKAEAKAKAGVSIKSTGDRISDCLMRDENSSGNILNTMSSIRWILYVLDFNYKLP